MRYPEKWTVGQRVVWIRDSNDGWGPSAGTTGVVVELREECHERKGHEYQVFWCSPDYAKPERNGTPMYWTTPEDVAPLNDTAKHPQKPETN